MMMVCSFQDGCTLLFTLHEIPVPERTPVFYYLTLIVELQWRNRYDAEIVSSSLTWSMRVFTNFQIFTNFKLELAH